MVYGACPFQHITGGPLAKMGHIANPENKIAYPKVAVTRTAVDPDGKPIDPTDLSVPVREAAIDAMKGCLTYNKDDRLTIRELLQHEFLQPPKDRKRECSTSFRRAGQSFTGPFNPHRTAPKHYNYHIVSDETADTLYSRHGFREQGSRCSGRRRALQSDRL
jgi:serine/threonine protein kinase